MKTLLICFSLLVLGSGYSYSQETSRVEVFGGYSLEHISACGAPGDTFLTCSGFIETGNSTPANYNGWDGSLSAFVYRFFGVSGDVSGHYGTTVIRGNGLPSASTFRYSFMFGPIAALRRRDYQPFVHALFGGVFNKFGAFEFGAESANVPSYTKFAWAVGGGIDLVASRRLSVRVGQFDYERVGVPNTLGPSYAPVGGYRFAAGIVFKL